MKNNVVANQKELPSYKENNENKQNQGNKGEKKVFFNFLGGNITVVVEKTLANNENPGKPKVNIVNADQCKRTRGIVQSEVAKVMEVLQVALLDFLVFAKETRGQLVRHTKESLVCLGISRSEVDPSLDGLSQPLPDLATPSNTLLKPGISGTILGRVSISLADLALHGEEQPSLVKEVMGGSAKVAIALHWRISTDLCPYRLHQCPPP